MSDETKNLPETGRRFVSDLLAIEVNTIVTDYGLTARDMPPAPVAVLDIAGKYRYYLRMLASELGENAPALVLDEGDAFTNGSRFFRAFNVTADHLRKTEASRALQAETGPLSSHKAKLARIREFSTRIARIIERSRADIGAVAPENDLWARTREDFANNLYNCATDAQALEIDPNDLAFIRKAWEIGTDEVAIQTVVQLSGDAVTRIVRGQSETELQALHHLHLQQVKTGVETWISVAELISKLVSGLAQAVGQGLGFRRKD